MKYSLIKCTSCENYGHPKKSCHTDLSKVCICCNKYGHEIYKCFIYKQLKKKMWIKKNKKSI